MNSSELLDVSFAGSTVIIAGRTIKDFMDDANPIDFQDIEVSQVGVNCNGVMIRTARPAAAMCSVTVIPASNDDSFFHDLLVKYHVQDGKNNAAQWETPLTAKIVLGKPNAKRREYRLSGGTMVGGPTGVSANGTGKMQGRTYRFAFAKVE